jgi:hypothetical protein
VTAPTGRTDRVIFLVHLQGDKKSSKKKDEPNPVYGETFIWNIPDLKNMELTIKVMDDDIASDDQIGKCKIKLEDIDFGDEPVPIERKVDNNLFAKDACIYLTIKYEDP